MVVVRRTSRGSYVLSELDGSISKFTYVALQLLPYYPRNMASLPVTHIVDRVESEIAGMGEDSTYDD